MKIDIVSNDDDFFKVTNTPEEQPVEEVVEDEVVEETPQAEAPVKVKKPAPIHNIKEEPQPKGKRGAPINNQKGLNWFKGTSWGD